MFQLYSHRSQLCLQHNSFGPTIITFLFVLTLLTTQWQAVIPSAGLTNNKSGEQLININETDTKCPVPVPERGDVKLHTKNKCCGSTTTINTTVCINIFRVMITTNEI